MSQVVGEGLYIATARRRLSRTLGGQGHANIGAHLTLALDRTVDVDLKAGIDQRVSKLNADFQGLSASDTGTGDAIKRAGIQSTATCPIG